MTRSCAPSSSAQLQAQIADSDKLSITKRAELRGQISTFPGLNRYLRVTGSGLLRVDAAAVRREAHLDGKWLLRCSDPKLSAADIAAGYKQLLEVERGWRDMKTHLDLRQVRQRTELTDAQRAILTKLDIDEPPRFLRIDTAD